MTDTPGADAPEYLRAELDETREKLADTVDLLAAKVDVKAQAEQRNDSVKSTVADKAAHAKNAAPPPVQHALEEAGAAASPAVAKAKQHKQLLIGASVLILLLIALRRWRSS